MNRNPSLPQRPGRLVASLLALCALSMSACSGASYEAELDAERDLYDDTDLLYQLTDTGEGSSLSAPDTAEESATSVDEDWDSLAPGSAPTALSAGDCLGTYEAWTHCPMRVQHSASPPVPPSNCSPQRVTLSCSDLPADQCLSESTCTWSPKELPCSVGSPCRASRFSDIREVVRAGWHKD